MEIGFQIGAAQRPDDKNARRQADHEAGINAQCSAFEIIQKSAAMQPAIGDEKSAEHKEKIDGKPAAAKLQMHQLRAKADVSMPAQHEGVGMNHNAGQQKPEQVEVVSAGFGRLN